MSTIGQASMQFEPGARAPGWNIPLCVPEIRGSEWAYVRECLDTNWVSSVGEYVDRFERQLAAYVGARHAVAVVNGTAALHIALLVAGVQPEDEVLVPALTFVASANAVRYVGAWPVFMDVEPDYWQMDPQKVADFATKECHWRRGELRNKLTGRRVRAIIPVHILGHPVDMDPIRELALRYGLVVIEDAAESLGAGYKGQMVGCLGDVACFSFNGNKIITTGGGGMIATNNKAWAQKAKYLTTQAKDDPVEFVHGAIGYNYRLTNIQAAMGCAQLEQLDRFIAKKRQIAHTYSAAFQGNDGISPMSEAPWADSTFWLYTVLVNDDGDETEGRASRLLLGALAENGIQARPLWRPLHMLPMYEQAQAYLVEHAPELHWRSLSLPCSVGLTPAELERVSSFVQAFLETRASSWQFSRQRPAPE